MRGFLAGCRCAAGALAIATPSAALASGTITSIGTIPGGGGSGVSGLSDNGLVAAGGAEVTPFGAQHVVRWTAPGGLQDLGVPAGFHDTYYGHISGDGVTITGTTQDLGPTTRGFAWTAAGGFQLLTSPAGTFGDQALGVSRDGSVVVGYAGLASGSHAIRWVNGAPQDLGIPTNGSSTAMGVSADGAAVAGYMSSTTLSDHPFRWTQATGLQQLGLMAGSYRAAGYGISADGQVVVGQVTLNNNTARAFRWTQATGMQNLGILNIFGNSATAVAANGDGSVVVGSSDSFAGPTEPHAFLWTASLGMVDLNTYLPTLGINLTGWTLTHASAITPDGGCIGGSGRFNGQDRGWVVVIPGPGAGVCLSIAVLTTGRRRRTSPVREHRAAAQGPTEHT